MKHTRTLFALLLALLSGAGLKAQGTISLDNFNVMYAGVENPITVAWPGYKAEELSLQIVSGEATITKGTNPGQYVVLPNNCKELTIYVSCAKETVEVNEDGEVIVDEDGENIYHFTNVILGEFKYRVKPLPDPVIKVNGYETGAGVCRSDFTTESIIMAMKDPNLEFKLTKGSVRILEVVAYIGNKAIGSTHSNRLTKEMVDAIQRAKKGDKLLFEASVMMPDGMPRTVYAHYTFIKECIVHHRDLDGNETIEKKK